MANIRVDMNPGSLNIKTAAIAALSPHTWFDASSILNKADAGVVAGWQDISGNDHDAVQATTANCPIYKANIINGRPVLRFDATDELRTAAFAAALTTPYTVIFVGSTTAAAAYKIAWGNLGGADMQSGMKDSSDWYTGGGAGQLVDTGNADNSVHVFSTVCNGASSILRVDGGAGTTGTTGTDTLTGLVIGDISTGGLGWTGDIAEMLVFSGALSVANHNIVGPQLAGKYGTTWTTAA